MIFIKRIYIIFIYIFKIKFTFSQRYILVYYLGKVTIAGGVTILTVPQDMRSWHVTFLQYETQFLHGSAYGAILARFTLRRNSEVSAEAFPVCAELHEFNYAAKSTPYISTNPQVKLLLLARTRKRIKLCGKVRRQLVCEFVD